MGPRVLVVDDEPPIVRMVAANLRMHGFEVLTAGTGEAALNAAEAYQPAVVVLDLGLPGIDGMEVLRRLRAWSAIPVVVLTAVHDEREKVAAFDAGADDYVTKPFGIQELLARVRVALRHGRGTDTPRVVETGRVRIDLAGHTVSLDDELVHLTRTEYRLLEALASNPGRICRHRYLLERVWGPGYGDESQYLHVYIASLRRKLDDPADPKLIATEPGMGYRFVTPPTGSARDRQAVARAAPEQPEP
jgi:two-component system, OmpR family, KDP operon response regulator KdpE